VPGRQPRAAAGAALTAVVIGLLAILPGLARGAGARADTGAPPTGSLHALHGPGSCLGGPGCAPPRGIHGDAVVSISPDGHTLYLVAGRALAVLARGADGRLSQLPGAAGCLNATGADGCAPVAGLRSAVQVVVTPDGTSAYVVARRGVLAFSRDPASGALTPLAGAAGCLDARRAGCGHLRGMTSTDDPLVVSPLVAAGDGTLYLAGESFSSRSGALHGAIAVLARDPATGALRQLPGRGGCVSDARSGGCAHSGCIAAEQSLAIPATGGALIDGSTDSLDEEETGSGALASFRADPTTGALTPMGCARLPDAVADAAPLPGSSSLLISTLYGNRGTGRVGMSVLRVTPRADGHLAPTARLACSNRASRCDHQVGIESTDLHVSPDGRTLYLSAFADGLTILRLHGSRASTLATPWGCLAGPGQAGRPQACRRLRAGLRSRAGTVGGSVALSPDGRDLYTTVDRVTPDSTRPLGVRAFAVTP
jgi:hypothetical protein